VSSFACRPKFLFAAAILASQCLLGCLSNRHIQEGVQPEFAAINPSRIIAVPLFLLPNPAQKVEVDSALVESDKLSTKLEAEILDSFRNQPNVNGVSFQAVRQTLGAQSDLYLKIDKSLRETSSLLFSTLPSDRALLTKDCVSRSSFLDFYAFCVNPQPKWIDLLNQFSRKILNADSALITIVTEYSKSVSGRSNKLRVGLALLVVDTNSGKLIWAKERNKEFIDFDQTSPDSVGPKDERFFDDEFWLNFPGRKIPIQAAP
jgi:hypothetical protein